ncbi:aspartic proteinase CDR1-like [Lotus japonicus]|uniref:aspartic proteinase CDR1-like n=1 Tax=Lotus japonicus TaxID=34305 RepID=UPI002589B2E3|nr:aspartic proteinase CDR1-like [Lotus japonicus]
MTCYSSIPLLLLFLCKFSLIDSLKNGFSVELIHRDSPKSPLHRPTDTYFLRVSNAVRRSFNRANRFNKGSTRIKNPESSVSPDDVGYIMSYSVGTPPFQLYGVVDTGSDFIWLQCQPCQLCYNQTTPIFDPSKSKTYRNVPCPSPTCESVEVSGCSQSNTCLYGIQYSSGSDGSIGDVSLETLTLESTSGFPISFPKTVIGCGHYNNGSFRGRISGIVGLGAGPMSLTSQLGSSIKKKFSYCLVPMASWPDISNASSKLHFGDAAVVSGHGTVSTPIKIIENVSYALTLEAFSVGNKRLDFLASSFKSNAKHMVIDSGSELTILPNDMYNKLELAVAEVVKLKRVEDPTKYLSLCYEGALDPSHFPIITAHFKGADVRLNVLNTFFQVSDHVVCFTFRSTEDPMTGIFGSLAQQNFLVGFDLHKKIVSFKPTDCTKQ